MNERLLEIQADYFKALSHPIRIKTVQLLEKEERCVCQIFPALGEEQSNVSRHLSTLKKVGILGARKDGVNIYYRIENEEVFGILELAKNSISKSIKKQTLVL